MNIPREAIEKAIEGGWIPLPLVGQMNYGWKWVDLSGGLFPARFEIWDDIGTDRYMHWEEIALDPSFWQSLGKALRWGKYDKDPESYCSSLWQSNAHRFYDLILTNQDTQPFWDEILKV